jgi:hypothetical protein
LFDGTNIHTNLIPITNPLKKSENILRSPVNT